MGLYHLLYTNERIDILNKTMPLQLMLQTCKFPIKLYRTYKTSPIFDTVAVFGMVEQRVDLVDISSVCGEAPRGLAAE